MLKKLTLDYCKSLLKKRKSDAHKGSFGHALLIAGNTGMMGSAVIASHACLRSGTGLLSVNLPAEERFILQTAVPEAMAVFRENSDTMLERFSAIGIGPGLGLKKDAQNLLSEVLEQTHIPVLLDADAINILAEQPKLLHKLSPLTILTPHPKEFDRLFGIHENKEARIEKAIQKAIEHNLVIVLKGHETLVTSAGISFLNTTGNAGLAKAGSGDALTGIITGLLAQKYEPFAAAKLGVFLHGLAADITLDQQSVESMLITDVIGNLGKAFKELA